MQCPIPAERHVRRVDEHNRGVRAHLLRLRFAEPELGHCGGHSVGKRTTLQCVFLLLFLVGKSTFGRDAVVLINFRYFILSSEIRF